MELALYPWDIAVVELDDAPPDATAPTAVPTARLLAKRHRADAVVWIERAPDTATLWFFDASDDSLHSHPLPAASGAHGESPEDPAELAAVALTLKTLLRGTPWESRIPTVVREPTGAAWEPRLELDILFRSPISGTSGEPRLGVWVSEWYGTSRWKVGAALGASGGLGMTFDTPASHGSLQDIDFRAALRARLRLAPRVLVEPKLGLSAHLERAEVTTASPADTESYTRVDPSIDFGLALGWQVTASFAWSVGIEALESIRYQRWLEGAEVAFAPAQLWIQGGTSIAWSFR